MPNYLRLISIIVFAVYALPAQALAEPKRPDQAELDLITQRGRMLAEYDSVVATATDAIIELQAKEGKKQSPGWYFAQKKPQGWFVSFGTLNKNGEAFHITYQSAYLDKSVQAKDAAALLKHPDEDKDVLYHMAKAFETCSRARHPLSNYNYAVLPAPNNRFYVYFFPGNVTAGEYLLGGDDRYLLSSDGTKILETRQMHKGILPYSPKNFPPADKDQLRAAFHTAVTHDTPEDTDVMHVLVRRPRIPEFISAGDWIFQVHTDGKISIESTLKEFSENKPAATQNPKP
ncbi:MAG: hypothetical protein K2X77_05205 [Candidatus Obscuribacterales bacterium]|jgi:hypothetical protein|nr:hypothetical protein [Candidatus Obscuribacterales bacterium]